MLNKNTYFQTDPLVAREFIAAPFPYSLIPKDSINMYYPENKGIRKDGVGVVPTIKGALENKGLFDIQSNSLNLPRLMNIQSPIAKARNEYTYSAAGQKLKVVQNWNPNYSTAPVIGSAVNVGSLTMNKTTDYIGNMIYEDGTLKLILIDGGYIENGLYYYYQTDHLGNNRVVADASGALVQKNHYYPFGIVFAETSVTEQGMQPYKFGGKELDQMNGLNLYDNLARFYDPAFPHTLTSDPLCEIYYPISPYSWCMNNPMRYIDPLGMDTIGVNTNGEEVWRLPGEGDDVTYTSADEVTVRPRNEHGVPMITLRIDNQQYRFTDYSIDDNNTIDNYVYYLNNKSVFQNIPMKNVFTSETEKWGNILEETALEYSVSYSDWAIKELRNKRELNKNSQLFPSEQQPLSKEEKLEKMVYEVEKTLPVHLRCQEFYILERKYK